MPCFTQSLQLRAKIPPISSMIGPCFSTTVMFLIPVMEQSDCLSFPSIQIPFLSDHSLSFSTHTPPPSPPFETLPLSEQFHMMDASEHCSYPCTSLCFTTHWVLHSPVPYLVYWSLFQFVSCSQTWSFPVTTLYPQRREAGGGRH
jgi:hypothetical protein